MMGNATRRMDWITSAHGGSAEPSSAEVSALKKQLDECDESRGRLFCLQCMAETMKPAIGKHFMTSVLVILFLLVVGTLVAKA
jgi:hypothetical protein